MLFYLVTPKQTLLKKIPIGKTWKSVSHSVIYLKRVQSKSIGDAFTAMNIPVATIYASPYCRCMDTAKIAFGEARKTFDLKGLKSTNRHEIERRVNVLVNMISTTPPTDKNTVLISHAENIEKAAAYPVNEGDAVVVLPLEEKGFRVIAYITSGQWQDMARTLNML